jgi:ubiquinone/menaquinone biosynthesis C-methylase UbiE
MNSHIKSYFEKLSIEQFRSKHAGFWNEQISRIILNNKLITNITAEENNYILDLGCGDLSLYKFLNEKFLFKANYVAIDFNSILLEKVKNDYQDIAMAGKINLIVADFLEYQFKNNSVNLVFLINVIPYLSNKCLNKILHTIYKTMKKSGLLVLTDIERTPFWETEFLGVKINYHKNLLDLLELHHFDIKAKHHIYFDPIKNISEIKMEIAKLYIMGK